MRYIVLLAALLAVSGCANCPGTSIPVKCKDTRLPVEAFPDTPEAIKAVPMGDMEELSKLVMKGRVMRDERLAEDDALISACTQYSK